MDRAPSRRESTTSRQNKTRPESTNPFERGPGSLHCGTPPRVVSLTDESRAWAGESQRLDAARTYRLQGPTVCQPQLEFTL